jgi:hypothetical protein
MSFFLNFLIICFIQGIGASRSKDIPRKALVIKNARDESEDLDRKVGLK